MPGIAPFKALPDEHPLLRETINLPDREPVRQSILAHVMRNARTVDRPVMHIMAGGGGAGKGVLKSMLIESGELPGEGSAAHIDPDDIKYRIPEFHQVAAENDCRAQDVVYRESGLICNKAMRDAIDMRTDCVLDLTMRDGNWGETMIRRAKSLGFRVIMHGIVTEPSIAVAGARARAIATGRHLPVEVLLNAHKGFVSNLDRYAAVCDEMRVYARNHREDGMDFVLAAASSDTQELHHVMPDVLESCISATLSANVDELSGEIVLPANSVFKIEDNHHGHAAKEHTGHRFPGGSDAHQGVATGLSRDPIVRQGTDGKDAGSSRDRAIQDEKRGGSVRPGRTAALCETGGRPDQEWGGPRGSDQMVHDEAAGVAATPRSDGRCDGDHDGSGKPAAVETGFTMMATTECTGFNARLFVSDRSDPAYRLKLLRREEATGLLMRRPA